MELTTNTIENDMIVSRVYAKIFGSTLLSIECSPRGCVFLEARVTIRRSRDSQCIHWHTMEEREVMTNTGIMKIDTPILSLRLILLTEDNFDHISTDPS